MSRTLTLTERVKWGVEIPIDQGIEGPNERCIELPLGLEVAALHEPGWVLDAGCSLLPAVNVAPKEHQFAAHIVHLTQNIQSEVVTPRGAQGSYVSADLRDLSIFADGAFDRVLCISTLEHVGCDNHQYGAACEADADSWRSAVGELWRVKRTQVFITIPVHPTGYNCGRWRYFTPDQARDIIFGAQVRFYACNQDGKWYGGTPSPLPFTKAPSSKVQQIACICS